MVKRVFLYIVLISVPVLAFLNVWQAFSYQEMEDQIVELEDRQMSLFEENKQRIIGIEYLRSPARLDRLAEEQLDLHAPGDSALIRLDKVGVPRGASPGRHVRQPESEAATSEDGDDG